MNITNYIKERIEKNRGIEGVNGDDIVDELQAVLSKIEELEKPMGHTETVKEIFPDG